MKIEFCVRKPNFSEISMKLLRRLLLDTRETSTNISIGDGR